MTPQEKAEYKRAYRRSRNLALRKKQHDGDTRRLWWWLCVEQVPELVHLTPRQAAAKAVRMGYRWPRFLKRGSRRWTLTSAQLPQPMEAA